jgi:pimeloyl-ACP methyl ester carboxylesterase
VTTPDEWLNREDFPFRSRYLDINGRRIHYVDEGSGAPLLMVHGTPTWSYLYRHLFRDLSRDYRVIAVDHPGFGLSDKPADGDYRPQALARNLEAVIDRLNLRDLTLVVHDFGGPIGLSYAIAHPDNVRALVLFNTWLWPLRGTRAERVSRFMAGRIGRWLYTRANFSPRVLLQMAFADKRALTRDVHRHYLAPFPSPSTRVAPWTLATELIASSDWFASLFKDRERIAQMPALVLWGMKDPAFTPADLARWQTILRAARFVEFPEAGHFVQEEAPAAAIAEIRAFLRQTLVTAA